MEEKGVSKSESSIPNEQCRGCILAHGLSQRIHSRFTSWNLTLAEQEVCRGLLDGLSLKQISENRKTNETTVRQQALSIYSKGGFNGRHELVAFFLKDALQSAGMTRGL
jgi:DNA-binding CsgD family transcriptional regulator